jgi:hypothetical protein
LVDPAFPDSAVECGGLTPPLTARLDAPPVRQQRSLDYALPFFARPKFI